MQIKVTLDQSNYDYLKAEATKNRRTLSAELNIIMEDRIKRATTPAVTTTPVLSYPPGVRGIPEEPYKVTAGLAQTPPVTTTTTDYERTAATTAYYNDSPTKIKKSVIGGDSAEDINHLLEQQRPLTSDDFTNRLHELEAQMRNPDDDYYKLIKKYCLKHNQQKELLDILSHPNVTYLKDNYEYTITKALGLSARDTLPKDGWLLVTEGLQ
jgi:hypothetical protein